MADDIFGDTIDFSTFDPTTDMSTLMDQYNSGYGDLSTSLLGGIGYTQDSSGNWSYDYGITPDTGSSGGYLNSLLSGLNTTLGTNLTSGNISGLLGSAGSTAASLYAAQLQADAASKAIAAQQQQFAQNQANLKPWVTAGVNALENMQNSAFNSTPTLNMPAAPNLASAGSANQQAFSYDPNSYFNSPVYQALMKSGTDAEKAAAAGKGYIGSGNQLAELQKLGMQVGAQYMNQDFNQKYMQNQSTNAANLTNYQSAIQQLMTQYNLDANTAIQLYNSQLNNQNALFNRQSSLAGLGQIGTNQLTDLGLTNASNVGNIGMQQAANQAGQMSNVISGATQGINSLLA